MSFIHKKGLKAKNISLDLYSRSFSNSWFWLWEDKGSKLYTAHKVWLMWKKEIQNVTNQAEPRFMGMLKSSLWHKLQCISAGQAACFCRSTSWENTLPLKDSLKLLLPNPFRGQDSHKTTPRNPFKLMMKWLKLSHFWLKNTKNYCRWVGSQNHKIPYIQRDPQGSLKSNLRPCTGLLVKFQVMFLT